MNQVKTSWHGLPRSDLDLFQIKASSIAVCAHEPDATERMLCGTDRPRLLPTKTAVADKPSFSCTRTHTRRFFAADDLAIHLIWEGVQQKPHGVYRHGRAERPLHGRDNDRCADEANQGLCRANTPPCEETLFCLHLHIRPIFDSASRRSVARLTKPARVCPNRPSAVPFGARTSCDIFSLTRSTLSLVFSRLTLNDRCA